MSNIGTEDQNMWRWRLHWSHNGLKLEERLDSLSFVPWIWWTSLKRNSPRLVQMEELSTLVKTASQDSSEIVILLQK